MAAAKKEAVQQEQQRVLLELSKSVRNHSFSMKRAVDQNDFKEALKHASNMLNELRTSQLTPANYYELYIQVFDELQFLEAFFTDLYKKGQTNIGKLYETVQHAGNVLTRLYLLITVGSVYIKSKEVAAKDVLQDLVEMVKGVQQPTRGLFLRYYLSQKTKDKLPDLHSEYEGHGGNVSDAIDFILRNFAEMVVLWVRMQHQGNVRARKRREKERKQLRILVGSNLERLSKLEGVDLPMYKTVVLPRVLEQILNAKDKIAQQYLMDCVILVFPDEFHLRTLNEFLTTCATLLPEVDVKEILVTLMKRIADFADASPDGFPRDINAFDIFYTHVQTIIDARKEHMSVSNILEMQAALMQFAIRCYPGKVEYVDNVLRMAVTVLTDCGEEKLDADNISWVVHLLTIPQDSLSLKVIHLDHYPKVMMFLAYDSRRSVAVKLLRSVLASNAILDSEQIAARLLDVLFPLVRDEDDSPPEPESSKEDFEAEQRLMARLVHLMKNENSDVQFMMYRRARKYFGHGGMRRIPHTLVPLVFCSLSLARSVYAKEQAGETPRYPSRNIFQFVHEICTALASSHPELSLRLFLQSAQAADACNYMQIAYEFFSQAFILYEDLVESKIQLSCMNLIIATLRSCSNFEPANYDNLITRATKHSAKLLRKPDQCRMVCLVSQLFWRGPATDEATETNVVVYHRPKEVLECLQRSIKIADVCMPQSCQLFVHILNQYMYFFEQGCPSITATFITGLIALITENIDSMDPGDARTEVETHYRNMLRHIEYVKSSKQSTLYDSVAL